MRSCEATRWTPSTTHYGNSLNSPGGPTTSSLECAPPPYLGGPTRVSSSIAKQGTFRCSCEITAHTITEFTLSTRRFCYMRARLPRSLMTGGSLCGKRNGVWLRLGEPIWPASRR
eukprot:1428802-Amphidinium_carterae.1